MSCPPKSWTSSGYFPFGRLSYANYYHITDCISSVSTFYHFASGLNISHVKSLLKEKISTYELKLVHNKIPHLSHIIWKIEDHRSMNRSTCLNGSWTPILTLIILPHRTLRILERYTISPDPVLNNIGQFKDSTN